MATNVPTGPGTANLTKAWIFIEQAQRIGTSDSNEFAANLEAAIIFGKSVQDWLCDKRGKAWLKSSARWEDPICKTFADMRDLIVHEDGSIEIQTKATVTISVPAAVAIAEAWSVRIVPAPGASARSRIAAAIRNVYERVAAPVRGWRARRDSRRRLAALRAQQGTGTVAREERIHFRHHDPAIANRPAIDVVSEYLTKLTQTI